MQSHKLKIHICFKDRTCYDKILTLPFKPTNGDVLSVDLGEDSPEGKRYCGVLLRSLVFDIQNEYWISRPDMYKTIEINNSIEDKSKREEDGLLP